MAKRKRAPQSKCSRWSYAVTGSPALSTHNDRGGVDNLCRDTEGHVGCSPRHVQCRFYTGLTPQQLFRKARVNKRGG
jgi:hypothetical protein